MNKELLKKIGIYAGILLLFIGLAYSYTPQVLEGKIVNQSDIASWKGMANEAMTHNEAHPEDPTAWTNSMFGGMPTTATIDSFEGDWTDAIYDFLLTGRRPASYLLIALIGGFLLMLSLGTSKLIAVAGAIAIAFCSYNMQIIQVGHNTKMQAIAYFPWVLAGVIFTYRAAMRSFANAQDDRKKAQDDNKNADKGRRAFLISTAIAGTAATVKAQEMKVDGGLTAISNAEKPERQTPIVPAGALSLKNFADHCTSCQLCVSVCPNQVLRPSTSLLTLMQPEMSYERGYCRPECTRCSDICPAGAIRPVTVAEKSSIQIGHAVVNLDNCVVNTDGVKCGNCARHCPNGAIRMVRKDPNDPKSLMIPTVNEERCIGCGACENLCPARPFTAIHIEGHEVHKTI